MRVGFPGYAALALALTVSSSAMATVIGTLQFRDPTGIIGPTDSVDVWLRLTLDPASDPLQTDGAGNVTSPDLGPNVSRSNLNEYFSCSGTFTNICTGGPPYDFNFNFGASNFVAPTNVNLAPGSVSDWLFGTFSPTGGGPVASGTYTFYDAGFFIQSYDANNIQFPDIAIADTCASQTSDCAFTRTVVASAVPEPASLTLFGSGLLALGAAFRRRRKAKV